MDFKMQFELMNMIEPNFCLLCLLLSLINNLLKVFEQYSWIGREIVFNTIPMHTLEDLYHDKTDVDECEQIHFLYIKLTQRFISIRWFDSTVVRIWCDMLWRDVDALRLGSNEIISNGKIALVSIFHGI